VETVRPSDCIEQRRWAISLKDERDVDRAAYTDWTTVVFANRDGNEGSHEDLPLLQGLGDYDVPTLRVLTAGPASRPAADQLGTFIATVLAEAESGDHLVPVDAPLLLVLPKHYKWPRSWTGSS